MNDPLVQVRGLEVDFRGTRALNGVSLEIQRGEIFGLVGGSGSGKSTLARAILGLLRHKPTTGEVLFEGQSVLDLHGSELARFRSRAQIVFQDPEASLNPRMTVGAALGEVLGIHRPLGDRPGTARGHRATTAGSLLEQVGLEAYHERYYPHQFSGGQRQRVSIARALAVGPEFLVLDEPLSALDVSVQAQILLLLGDLRKRLDLTYLFISHDLAVVENVADRVAVMEEGTIVETGPAAQVFRHPRQAYTKRLIASIPRALVRP